MRVIKIFGLIVLLIGLYLAFFQNSPFWYSFFLVGGFLFFEGMNLRNKFSILGKPKIFLILWGIFFLFGILVELFMNSWLDLWDYPSFDLIDYVVHVLVIGIPFIGFFSLEFFVYLRRNIKANKYLKYIIMFIAALLYGLVNEFPNTFAHEWAYKNWPGGDFLGIPVAALILWVLMLFILIFENFFNLKRSEI